MMGRSSSAVDRDVTTNYGRPSLIDAVRNAFALARGHSLLVGLFLLAGTASAVLVMLERGRIVGTRGDILLAVAGAVSLLASLIAIRYATVDPDDTGVFWTQLKHALLAVPVILIAEVVLFLGLYVVLLILVSVVSGVPLLVLSAIPVLFAGVFGALLIPALTIDGHDPFSGVREAWRCLGAIPFTVVGTLVVLGLVVFGLSLAQAGLHGASFAAVSGLLGVVNGLGLLIIGYIYVNAPTG